MATMCQVQCTNRTLLGALSGKTLPLGHACHTTLALPHQGRVSPFCCRFLSMVVQQGALSVVLSPNGSCCFWDVLLRCQSGVVLVQVLCGSQVPAKGWCVLPSWPTFDCAQHAIMHSKWRQCVGFFAAS